MTPTTILETSRLRLRQVLDADFDALYHSVFSDAAVTQYTSGSPLSRDDALAYFNEVFDHEGSGRKPGVLLLRGSNEIVGYAGLMPCRALDEDDYELGFVLKRDAWRNGYGTEIGLAQLDYGYRVAGKERILAQVRPGNEASRKTLKGLGMEFVKEYERPGRGLWQVFKHERLAGQADD